MTTHLNLNTANVLEKLSETRLILAKPCKKLRRWIGTPAVHRALLFLVF